MPAVRAAMLVVGAGALGTCASTGRYAVVTKETMPATADLMMVMKELRVEKVFRALVRWDRIRAGALLVIAAGCIHSGPHLYGQYNDLAPKVAPTAGERTPRHLTVQLAKPANVAVFLVVPGRGSRLLFPQDSLQNQYVEAGSHLVETAAAANALNDTSRLTRLPPGTTPPSQPPQG